MPANFSLRMKHFMKQLVLCIFFYCNMFFVFAENDEQRTEEKALYPAFLGGILTNTVFHVTSRILGADFAQTSRESVKTNLTSPWVWDNDAFLFNHPGHPYQGGLYHAAARSNGFTFYESFFFNGLGSLTWELFGETDTPSLNDLIVTTFGGAAFGEMLHRLYLETASPWAGIPVSPMDALNNAVLRKNPARTQNLYYFSLITGAAWTRTIKDDRRLLRNRDDLTSLIQVFTANIGVDVVYGDPFIQNSKKPYSHFEIKIQTGGSFYSWWFDWTVLTDGYLASFNPVHNEQDKLSTGLTMHYDLITGSNVNFANNALAWSIKWNRRFKASQLELKSHIGWTFLGSSEYYPFAEIDMNNLVLHESENDYGTGGNLKLFFSLQNQKFGKITLGLCNYLLYMIPLNIPDSGGIEYLNLSFLEYSYPFTERFSIIANNYFYLKSGRSRRDTDVVSVANRVFLGALLTFLDKGRSQ